MAPFSDIAQGVAERVRRSVSRRGFVGGAALSTAALGALSLSGCAESTENGSALDYSGESQEVEDSEVTYITDEYDYVDDEELTATYTWTLPLGTVLFHCEGSWAAAMMAPESALTVNTLGVVSIVSGTVNTLVSSPITGSAYDFYDVRCSSGVFAWVEDDFSEGEWVLYGQAFKSGELSGSPVKLDSGDADWEPAKFTTTGSSVIWLKMPLASGSASTEYSHCYLWNEGDSASSELYESPGRFATAPRVSDGILTISPRVLEDEGTYYGMTAINLSSLNTIDQLVMPASVKPFEATYINERFAFSVEANYGYGGSLGNMGSYLGREGEKYIALSREPLACTVGDGETRYFIKVKSSHYVVDTDAETYSVLTAPSDSLDYGDYPASEGTSSVLVTYSTVRGEDGAPESVYLRVFDLSQVSEAASTTDDEDADADDEATETEGDDTDEATGTEDAETEETTEDVDAEEDAEEETEE